MQRRDVILFVILAATWVLWSGYLADPLLMGLGAGSCVLVTWLSRRMDAHDGSPTDWRLACRALGYIPWLLLEILKANLHVARLILDRRLPIQPQLVRGPADQKTELGQVIYANSITLTPGTITLDLREGGVLVHAISDRAAKGITDGVMNRRVARMEDAE